MYSIPTRLIANQEKVDIIKAAKCGNCKLNRRTNLKQILTPGGELGADIWQSKDIFGLSVNIDLCNIEELSIDSQKDDVNIIPIDTDDTHFISNEQLSNFNFDNIEVEKLDTLIVYMIVNELSSIDGTYPFKKGTPEEIIHNFKLEIIYKPMVLNVFHFQVEILSNESGNWKYVSREASNKKKYIRALASKIRARFLDERKIHPLVL